MPGISLVPGKRKMNRVLSVGLEPTIYSSSHALLSSKAAQLSSSWIAGSGAFQAVVWLMRRLDQAGQKVKLPGIEFAINEGLLQFGIFCGGAEYLHVSVSERLAN